jgi:3-hydroxyisobutyrate dehydrogenase
MKIGFIGLGNMGAPMAGNLLKAGHRLVVFDVVPAVGERLAAQGAQVAESPQALAQSDVELVITMLPSSAHARSVYLGDDGLLDAAAPGVLLVDCSTIDPHTTRDIAAAAAKRSLVVIDAPVSGGTAGAAAGTLTFMVGGDAADVERARPVLGAMGRNVVHCGPVGNGEVAKLCNNLLLAISMIGVSEAMSLGVALGIDAQVLAGIINTSTGRCWSSEQCNPWPGVTDGAPAARGYQGGFAADLMLKDLGLAADAARLARQPIVLGGVAEQLYRMLGARGDGTRDFSAIVNLYRKA